MDVLSHSFQNGHKELHHLSSYRYGGFSFGDQSTAAPNGTIDWTEVGDNLNTLWQMFLDASRDLNVNWTKNHREPWASLDIINGSFLEEMNSTERFREFLSGLDTRANMKV